MNGVLNLERVAWKAYKRAVLDRLRRDMGNRPGNRNPSDVRTPETERLFGEWLPLRREVVAAGVCPCCNRSFTKLAMHMKSKHPDYNVVPLKAAKA